MIPDLIDKAVWLESMERVLNVIGVLDQLYDSDMWVGGILFRDTLGGFLLVATFDRDTYIALGTPWERLFPPAHLRAITLDEACAQDRRYHPWLRGEIPNTLRLLRLLPSPGPVASERGPSLAQVRAERDPPIEAP